MRVVEWNFKAKDGEGKIDEIGRWRISRRQWHENIPPSEIQLQSFFPNLRVQTILYLGSQGCIPSIWDVTGPEL